ncbi:hypothetical protein NUW58_g6294 [Xylaria curta]|uniref:Uncharacterized protein n=1 Tax=Xylaria curta TaxID=42375 RepID=A0ACC1NXZ0_9PEZI|nr:hypothetical protein NUW58_g6294 [Xylaria curta]
MASDAATVSIAGRVAQSLTTFEAINAVETQAGDDDAHLIWVQQINDQLAKFKLWAGNIGAHRTGRSSLDYRLRDSSHLHTQVIRLLDDLITSLNEVHSILSGETLPWDLNPGDEVELDEELKDLLIGEDFEFDSEMSQLMKEIADSIGNLLRLSISLRNPAPHDRFMSTEYAKVCYFEATDKAHVEAKFPRTHPNLIIRVGQALSQKRQYFRYRESHHEKLAHGMFHSGRSEVGAQSTVASSIPLAMRDPGSNMSPFGRLDEDERSETGFSQTSFATTAPGSENLRIPPLPKKAYDGPFECPFCYMLISASTTYQWKKHVLCDLRPYICLAENCAVASREYGRRHEWMNHVLQKHWKLWTCPYQCDSDYTTETSFRQHIVSIHGSATDMELDALIARCGRTQSLSPSAPVECPFCQDKLNSVREYQRHVGRHQVDLALFALPRIEDDEEEPGELNEHQDTTSTHSSSYYSNSYSDVAVDHISTELAEPPETTSVVPKGESKALTASLSPKSSRLSQSSDAKSQDDGSHGPLFTEWRIPVNDKNEGSKDSLPLFNAFSPSFIRTETIPMRCECQDSNTTPAREPLLAPDIPNNDPTSAVEINTDNANVGGSPGETVVIAETRFDVVHTIRYTLLSPTSAEEKTESLVIATCSTLFEANDAAMSEVQERYGGLAHSDVNIFHPPDRNWIREAGTVEPSPVHILRHQLLLVIVPKSKRSIKWKTGSERVLRLVLSLIAASHLALEEIQTANMGSRYLPTNPLEEEATQWHQAFGSPVSFISPENYQRMDQLPLYHTSTIRNPQRRILDFSDLTPPPHGLPTRSLSPIETAEDYDIPGRRQSAIPSLPSHPPPFSFSPVSSSNSTQDARRLPQAWRLDKTQLRRRRELEEIYPLKLIRELDRNSRDLPRTSKGKPVFCVIHVNKSIDNGLAVENIGTYTTVQAANDRALDFWDQMYGTEMFTDATPIFGIDAIPTKFEHFEELDDHSQHARHHGELVSCSSGGVPANNSYWTIDNKCLSLAHIDYDGEKKVLVVISYVRDQGIHV